MALRKISQATCRTRVAKVYRDAEWDQYVVRFTVGTTRLPGADYFTHDKRDALETAAHWVQQVVGIPMRNMRDFDRL